MIVSMLYVLFNQEIYELNIVSKVKVDWSNRLFLLDQESLSL